MINEKSSRRNITNYDVQLLSNGNPVTITIIDNCGTLEMELKTKGRELWFHKVIIDGQNDDFMENLRDLIKVATIRS